MNRENTNHEYEYKGMCINGFLMIFFTFILLPAMMVGTLLLWAENNPGLATAVMIPLFIIFILGCAATSPRSPTWPAS